jgi:uncharacterized protein (DUF433 family)
MAMPGRNRGVRNVGRKRPSAPAIRPRHPERASSLFGMIVGGSQAKAYLKRAVALSRAVEACGVSRSPFVSRGGLIFFRGMSVPVRSLEPARRAGSSESALRAAFPDLPVGAFDAIDASLTRRPRLAAAWAAPSPASAGMVADLDPDSGEGFHQELETLLVSHAELFRRLAR